MSALASAPTPQRNPLDDLDDHPAGNPLDQMDSPSAADTTASRMQDVTDQAQMPEVTVSAKREYPPASWSDVARGIPTAIGAGIETKIAGAQEYLGHSAYDDARKKFWQATVLPQAVRDAQKQGAALTDMPEVQSAAEHLGIRPDTFTRDWPTYVNQSQEQLEQFKSKQRDRLQTGSAQMEAGTKRRLTAQQVQEIYAPHMDDHSLKALVFDAATMSPDILAGVGATVATGGVGGAAVMAADIAPNEYAAARNKGLDHDTASTYAVLSTLASSVPEVPVLKIVENTPLANKIIGGVVGDKLAQTGVGKVAGTAAAQGVTQSVVNALQQGIDAGVLNQHLPLDEALKQVAWSGLVGSVVGAPMGAFHAATSRTPKPTVLQTHTEAGEGATTVHPTSTETQPTESAEKSSEAPEAATSSSQGSQPSSAEHAALLALKDKSITPPQADMLEKLGLIKRNDLNEPIFLPAGRRRLTQLNQEVSDGVVHPQGPQDGTPEHRLATDQDLRDGLTAMKDETGWAEEGGRVIRDATTDEVVGRTKWLPRADWWPDRPKGLTESQVHDAVDKALAGQPLKAREQSMIDFMTQVHDERTAMNQRHAELREAVPDLDKQPEGALDLTLLASRASDHDRAATVQTLDSWNDDHPETIARVRGELESIIARGSEKQQTPGGGTEEPAKAQGAPQGQEESFQEALARAEAQTNTAPTEGQKQAGTYKKGVVDFAGMKVAIENPKGSTRSGIGPDGKPWSREMSHTYGYVKGTEGKDGDAVDAFLTGKPDTGKVFVINQIDPATGKLDEHKSVLGADSQQEAEAVYRANYPKGWRGLGSIAEMPTEKFKEWLDSGNTNRAVPGAERVDRRVDTALRGRVKEMTPDQLRAALLTHELTGIPNRRAYQEAEKLPHQVAIDVDSLKWVNDEMGHESGDMLLKAIGTALARHTDEAYHISGDEFAAQTHTETEAHELMSRIQEHLKGAQIEVTMPDGRVVELKGFGVSYGVGKNAQEADAALSAHKARREAQGERAARGQAPPGSAIRAREAGRQDNQGHPPAGSEKEVEPKFSHRKTETLYRGENVRNAGGGFYTPEKEFARQFTQSGQDHEIKRLKLASDDIYEPAQDVYAGNPDAVDKAVDEARAAGKQAVRLSEGPGQPKSVLLVDKWGKESKYRRTEGTTSGLPLAHVQRIVHQTIREANLVAGFPHVEVHQDVSTLPQSIKSLVEQQGAERLTGAVYDPGADRIHLIAGNNGSEREVRENLWHEAVGHHGLRLAMDRPTYNAVMDGINRDMPERVQAAAQRNGLDVSDVDQRRAAAEEVIAYAAGQHLSGQPIDKPVLPYWKRAVRAVKAFFSKMRGKPFYDDKAIAGLIQQARTALEGGTAGTLPGEPPRSQRAPMFYSPVERAISESKQGKASAEQWLATLKKQSGVKPEELEWLNLDHWLKDHKGPVTKEELADYVRANRLELQETVHGERIDSAEQTEDERAQIQLAEKLRAQGHQITFTDEGYLDHIGVRGEDGDGIESRHYSYNTDDMERLPDSLRSDVEELNNISTRVGDERTRRAAGPEGWTHLENDGTQYGEYTLPGGGNYRELLLQLPTQHHGALQPIYKSGHWREPNILAHVRFNERTDSEGKKVLHLEEIQSDWHQVGRKQGYRPEKEARLAELVKRRDEIQALLWDFHGKSVTAEQKQEWVDAQNEIKALTEGEVGVPSAPFKTSWPMLAMKRMIRHAAENGFDRISWTTGDQQADRYNLAQHIDRIVYSRDEDGKYWLYAERNGQSAAPDLQNKGMTKEQVGEYVGQELAEKMERGEGQITSIYPNEKFPERSLSGLDLHVGGSGMKGFYDSILPRETDKLIKKYGAKVGRTEVIGPDPTEAALSPNAPSDTAIPVHGFDITEPLRQAALSQGFPMFSRRQQELPLEEQREPGAYPIVRRAVSAVAEAKGVRDLRKLINPVGMSAESRQVAQIAREALGKLAHETVQTQEALERFSREIDKTPIPEQLAMMDAIERGVEQPNPEMQPVADAMRKLLDDWRGKVQGLGEGYLDNFIENYFPHYWRFPDEAQRMVASIMGRRPLRGPASFLKMRTIPSIKEGMDAGLTPLTTNPLIMTLLKTREMQRFVTGVTLMRRFKEDGLAKFLPAGHSMPDGWGPINDNIAKVRSWSEEENGFIERGQYIMPIDAARVINNHVSASALRDFAPAQIFRRGANALNAMQLGFSAFHLGFTTLDAMISKNAQALERLAHGEVGKAAASFVEGATPVGAVMNVRRGYKLLQAYSNPAGATPDMQRMVQMLTMAGGRAHMDRYYQAAEGVSPFRGVGVRSLANDIRQALTAPQDKIQNLGRALGHFPIEYANKLWKETQEIWKTTPKMEVPVEMAMRVVRASTSWIMEHLVPMQKLGVFSDLAADHLRRNPTQDPNDRAAAMQRIWDSVDNRLGEMVYDNLFWNRTMKDSLHLGIRAVGWNVGTVREIGGAPIDMVKAVDKAIRTGKVSADDLGHRIPYVLAMAGTTALYSAIYQYMATGQGPQELKDYFFPRTGGTTNYGTPERVSLPSYVKDVYEYSQRPGQTIVNKLNPIFSLIGNLYSNQDFFGNPISDPEASYWHQKLQQAQFAAHEMTPFSLQGRQQMQATEQPSGFGASVKKALPMIGVTPAPGYITSPEQLERRDRLEQDQKYTGELKYKIKKALMSGDKATAAELTKEYVESVKRMNQTKATVGQDKAKAAAARRKTSISMRQAGYPATADLVASLPLEPDRQARDYFAQTIKENVA